MAVEAEHALCPLASLPPLHRTPSPGLLRDLARPPAIGSIQCTGEPHELPSNHCWTVIAQFGCSSCGGIVPERPRGPMAISHQHGEDSCPVQPEPCPELRSRGPAAPPLALLSTNASDDAGQQKRWLLGMTSQCHEPLWLAEMFNHVAPNPSCRTDIP